MRIPDRRHRVLFQLKHCAVYTKSLVADDKIRGEGEGACIIKSQVAQPIQSVPFDARMSCKHSNPLTMDTRCSALETSDSVQCLSDIRHCTVSARHQTWCSVCQTSDTSVCSRHQTLVSIRHWTLYSVYQTSDTVQWDTKKLVFPSLHYLLNIMCRQICLVLLYPFEDDNLTRAVEMCTTYTIQTC